MRLVMPLLLLMSGCVSALDAQTWLITGPRLLAVRANPAEAAPGKKLELQALVVGPTGEIAGSPLNWAACSARPPLAQQAPVAATCLTDEGQQIQPIADSATATWSVPNDVCGQFGPNPPVSVDGGPAGRPADPDETGGWYAPIRVEGPSASSDIDFFRVRLRCPLAGTTQQQSADFQKAYRTNAPPQLAGLFLQRATGTELAVDVTAVVTLQPGETVTWRASWPDCGDHAVCGDGHCDVDERLSLSPPDPTLVACKADCQKPQGCGGAERYLRFDATSRALVIQREALSTAFYTTAGTLSDPSVGRTSGDPGTDVRTGFTAPATPGTVWLWLVLRDDRGGIGWQGWQVSIHP